MADAAVHQVEPSKDGQESHGQSSFRREVAAVAQRVTGSQSGGCCWHQRKEKMLVARIKFEWCRERKGWGTQREGRVESLRGGSRLAFCLCFWRQRRRRFGDLLRESETQGPVQCPGGTRASGQEAPCGVGWIRGLGPAHRDGPGTPQEWGSSVWKESQPRGNRQVQRGWC